MYRLVYVFAESILRQIDRIIPLNKHVRVGYLSDVQPKIGKYIRPLLSVFSCSCKFQGKKQI